MLIRTPDRGRLSAGHTETLRDALLELVRATNDLHNQIDRLRPKWQTVPFAAGNFTASAGTWTVASGDVDRYAYAIIGRLLSLQIHLSTTTTGSGMGTSLYIALPENLSAINAQDSATFITTGTITEACLASTRSGADATSLDLTRLDGSAWPSSITDNLGLRGMMVLEI